MGKTELIKQIKEGIRKSGFPLELRIGSNLEKEGWGYSVGDLYEDFETGKTREVDLTAQKQINGISVKLFIECKKSEEKQIVLYAPKSNKFTLFINYFLKLFPLISPSRMGGFSISQNLTRAFSKLRLFDSKIPFSQNLIVTRGDKVTEDNISYISSINGLVKRAVWSASDGYIETNFRSVFLYILVFDGALFQLASSKTEAFDLKEIEYGQLKFKYDLKINTEIFGIGSGIANTAFKFGNQFIIEIMTPGEFEVYIKELEKVITEVEDNDLKGWGTSWPVLRRVKKRRKN